MFKAMARRAQIIMALFAGAAFGSAATGCGFLFLATAHADSPTGILSATCSTQGTASGQPATFAVLSLPGRTKEDLALNVTQINESPGAAATAQGDTFYNAADIVYGGALVADGAVARQCISGPGSVVTFFVR